MNKKYIILFLTLIILLIPVLTYSANITDIIEGLDKTAEKTILIDPNEEATTIYDMIGRILFFTLSLLGIIFLGLIIFGGIGWLTAAGNEEKITKAKGLMSNALIGLIIIIAAYTIANFVIFTLADKITEGNDSLCIEASGECQNHALGATDCTINGSPGTYASNYCGSQSNDSLYRCCIAN